MKIQAYHPQFAYRSIEMWYYQIPNYQPKTIHEAIAYNIAAEIEKRFYKEDLHSLIEARWII